MIVGTAGHIDHGKTSLIRRLTGKDTDRLPEEKRRGISIELGYAYLPVGDAGDDPDAVMGFVDVPGHERFVHAMVSGASGIDVALLVVAADDGPMPQTLEHLDILRLLGVDDGLVVLTKIDAVEQSIADQSVAAISAVLAPSAAARWPLFPVSSLTGEGIEELRQHLVDRARNHQARRPAGHFRLAVDRVFSLQGLGTVVTGTAHAGQVRVGDEVVVMAPGQPDGAGRAVRVRSIHAQDRVSETGRAGQRLALNLVGVAAEDIPRGSWINGRDLRHAVSRVDATVRMPADAPRSIGQGLEVHLHHGALDLMARIHPLDTERLEPGQEGLVSISLDTPIAVCRGDRLVIRDSQARHTLAGGRVLDIMPPARGRRAPARLELLDVLRSSDPAVALAAAVASAPMPISRLCAGWNLRADEVDALVMSAQLVRAADTLLHPLRWENLRERAVLAVDETHLREPEMPGIELNRLRRVIAPAMDADAFGFLMDQLVADGLAVRRGVFLARPAHQVELSPPERHLWMSISPLLDESPFNPPRVRDIAKMVNIQEAEIRANLRRVARIGEVTLVALDHFFLTQRVAEMAGIVQELADQHGEVRAADFRDRIGGGRKVAIQILEFFDRIGYTRRLRDAHLPRRSNPFAGV